MIVTFLRKHYKGDGNLTLCSKVGFGRATLEGAIGDVYDELVNQLETGGEMPNRGTQVVTALVPIALAKKVDKMAERLRRSRDSIVNEALLAWLDQEQAREQLTREAIEDARAGNLVDHEAVQAWVDSLGSNNSLLPVRDGS